jgi:hypothetical protein
MTDYPTDVIVNPTHKRTRGEKERDMGIITRLYLQGYNQTQIHEKINEQYPLERRISLRRISYDIQEIVQEWHDSSTRELSQFRSEQLQKLDAAEREFWEAWEKSKDVKETTTTEATSGGTDESPLGRRTKVQRRREQQVGDPRFLDGVLKVIDYRSKLLGLNEPVRVQLSMIQSMRDEELEQLIKDISSEVQLPSGIIEGEAREVSDSFGGGEEAGAEDRGGQERTIQG